jgi:hypothetical protein
MTRNPEGHRNWDLDLRHGDEEDEFLADESYTAGIDTLTDDFAEDDDYDSVDIIADELSLMGIPSASDFS